MPDRKSSSFIFSFNKKQRSFFKLTLAFFIPVILAFCALEYLVLRIPQNYTITSEYFKNEHEEIEIMALGPSQTNAAINPAQFDKKAISLASTSQHHNLDFKILKQTKDRLPNLKYIILELSYSHLELPHNSKNFWKNHVYLKYYDVNAFERNTYFKDKLILTSRPDIYSKELVDYYVKKKERPQYNKYGFQEDNFDGHFKSLGYDVSQIDNLKFRINKTESIKNFRKNTILFFEILDYIESQDLNVIVCTVPMYRTFLKERNPNILSRRDSILGQLEGRYPNLKVFDKENDTINFEVTDYINQNHLNSKGGEKFSLALNRFIKNQFQD